MPYKIRDTMSMCHINIFYIEEEVKAMPGRSAREIPQMLVFQMAFFFSCKWHLICTLGRWLSPGSF